MVALVLVGRKLVLVLHEVVLVGCFAVLVHHVVVEHGGDGEETCSPSFTSRAVLSSKRVRDEKKSAF